LATSVVFLAYLTLLINELLFDLGYSSLTNRVLINSLLTFFPSGTLLIMAAVSVVRRQIINQLKFFVGIYSIEALAAGLNLLTETALFSVLFACASLLAFGWSIRWLGSNYSDKEVEQINPHPNQVSKWIAVTYTVWGLSQFSLLLLSENATALSGLLKDYTSRWDWMELLLTEPGSLMLLLYPKGIATFFTILFLLSLETVRFRETLRSRGALPFLQIDRKGRIINHHQFPEEPHFSSIVFSDLVSDPEDRREIEYVIEHEVKLESYICRIPELAGTFGESLVEITLSRIDTWGYPRRLWLRPVDRSKLALEVDRQFCEDLSTYLEELATALGRVDLEQDHRGEAMVFTNTLDDFRKFSQIALKDGADIIDRTRHELLLLQGEDKVLSDIKADVASIWLLIKSEIERFCQRNESFSWHFEESPIARSSFPTRLRINTELVRIIVNCILLEIRRSHDKSIAQRISLSIAEARSATGSEPPGFVSFSIQTSWSDLLKEALLRARNHRLGILQNRSLLFAKRSLEFFGGRLLDDERSGELVIILQLRYLFSSLT